MRGDDQDGCGNLKQRNPALDVKCLIPILATPLGAKHRALHFTEEDAEIRSCPKCSARWDVNSDEPCRKAHAEMTGKDDLVSRMHARTASTLLRTGWAGVSLLASPDGLAENNGWGSTPSPVSLVPAGSGLRRRSLHCGLNGLW